jgi:hypothetical protein
MGGPTTKGNLGCRKCDIWGYSSKGMLSSSRIFCRISGKGGMG